MNKPLTNQCRNDTAERGPFDLQNALHKVAALAATGGAELVIALALAHALSRSVTTVVAWRVPPARRDGLSVKARRVPALAVTISVGTSLAAGRVALAPIRPIAAFACCCIVGAAVASLTKRHIGSQTGDVLGCVQQAAEAALLVTLTAYPTISQ